MKLLHGFELKDKGLENGEEATQKTIELAIKRPTRVDKEEADLAYSEHYSKCINRGINTKAMLANRYTDAGGTISEKDEKEHRKIYVDWVRLEEALIEERSLKKKSKAKIKDLEDKILNYKDSLIDFYSNQQRLFENTAEAKSDAHVVLWYVIMLSYVRWEEDGELVPYFTGETFEERLDDYDKREEEGEDFFLETVKKLTIYLTLYYYNGIIREEDFKKFEENLKEEAAKDE